MPPNRKSSTETMRLIISAIRYVMNLQATVSEINERTKRIAARHNSLERSNVELQEVCFNYWNSGRNLRTLRQGALTKVTYQMVYDYYKNELLSIGVTSSTIFKRMLMLRTKRLNRLKGTTS